MKKFEVKMCEREFTGADLTALKRNPQFKFVGCTRIEFDEPVLIKSFNTIEEAKNELKKYESELNQPSHKIFLFSEYFIEENEYNEDGEWINGGDVWEYTDFPIYTADRETGSFIERFDTIAEARKAIEEYEKKDEAEGTYSEDFYDVVDNGHSSLLF